MIGGSRPSTRPSSNILPPRSFNHNLDEHGFRQVQEHQKLMVDFPEYSNVLIRMLNNCIKEPHRYQPPSEHSPPHLPSEP